ncbi:MAG: ATP-binding protein [Blastomonas fulva]|uniref:ATP-binding protein n=1 Tax=Blastomonas fulva TaxID=1550728 RepID=UPI0040334C94
MTSSQENAEQAAGEFNLEPDPRVLPMLGEINIDQWRCVAELIDNAVDGFLKESRAGTAVVHAQVDVHLPQADVDGATLRIIDNGSGMAPDVLERAVRAGWSGNNPIDSLGLFGMGFNIATARLGSVTEVWTTRKGEMEWHGLRIDFDALRRQRHFRTPHLKRPKADPDQHGTEITLKQLKPEQRRWLAKNANQTAMRKRLAQAYSSMLRTDGIPISFSLYVNHKRIEARQHCLWNQDRVVPGPGGTGIHAVMPLNNLLADRLYCTNCMSWLVEASVGGSCPNCEAAGSVVKRARKVTGWLGIQRYLDQSDFGIDFIRNGRKIEIGNKDLFSWHDGENEEREYPIDDQRNRGRIVGEIHIDHCRVSYAKDRFDRADPTWDEMVRLVRGEGPLRPEKAKDLGYGPNDSPLFMLFKAFRRTSPQSKAAGAYARILIVKDNARASEMANAFHDGNPEYQDDTKWWELVEAADRDLLYGQGGGPASGGADSGASSSGPGGQLPPGLLDDPSAAGGVQAPNPEPAGTPSKPPPPPRREVPLLSRRYHHSSSGLKWNVLAFEVGSSDPELPTGSPWGMVLGDVPTKTYHFLFDPGHPVFRSITMTARDALLTQLAFMTIDQTRSSAHSPDVAQILSELREEYSEETALDFKTLPGDASAILVDVARGIVSACPENERASLFNSLNLQEQTAVMRALAAKKIKPAEATVDGAFLASAPFEIVRSIVEQRPDLCFDGRLWDAAYAALDYVDPEITDEARVSVLTRYLGLMSDAIWLSKQDSGDLADSPRDEVIRAVMSLGLLKPDTEPTS